MMCLRLGPRWMGAPGSCARQGVPAWSDKLRLSRKERCRIVRGAYGMREGSQVDKMRVLLLDDVFTTGATLDACARVLRKAGATRVVGLTVARVVPAWWSPGGQEPGAKTR